MLALCVGTYANDTDVSVDRPAEIPTEITYTSYNTICSLLVPVIRGVFFRVAPPIYSLGTFPVAASVHVRRANSQTRPFISPRECSGEAWSPTLSSVPVKRASSHTRPFSSPRECSGDACNPTRSLTEDPFTRTYNPSILQTNGRRHFGSSEDHEQIFMITCDDDDDGFDSMHQADYRSRTRVYEIEGIGVSRLSRRSDRYNIVIYPFTTPCMCSPLVGISTGSLGTFPTHASAPLRRARSQKRPRSSLRRCSREAWNPTHSSVPVRRMSSKKRPRSSSRRCNEEAWTPTR